MTDLEDKRVGKHKREVYGQFEYHERWLPSVAMCYQSDALLRILDEAVESTREQFGHNYWALLLMALP